MNKAQEFWDKQAKSFDDFERQTESATREIIAVTKKYLAAHDNVLDFGCATGNKTLKFAAGVKHIHGLDFSPEMISEAVKKKQESGAENVSFSQGTIFSNELEKLSFDKIIALSIIHLLKDSGKVIQRINELLKPGGLLISETACFKEKMDPKTRSELELFPLHLNMFTTSDVERLIKSRNFNIIESGNILYNGIPISFIVAQKSGLRIQGKICI
ncbi:MAG TPA: class I SAM-dependent methyltransferase [Bacteroidales bacterium]|jgi:2-polyprenyl-3-methyl-5-hydroxy-6-metoxy-1,4-benzoquinol methylase|nr:class I SAM-dependent methyltransferase [Bacteroidales bacterium]